MDWHTIGEVSKLCKIPIRTLRYYDDIGLLKPDRISPDTNYRYYSKEGLRKIPLIKYYKQLGFKLEDIGRMLERQNFDVLEDFMAKELLVVEKQMAELRKKHFAIQEWHRLLKQGESLLAESGESGEVRVAAFPLYRTMKFRYEVKEFQAADMEVLYSNILVELCHRYQVFAYGPFMLYFDDFGRRVDQSFTEVDCYTAVIEDGTNEAQTTEVGGFPAVSVVHRGDYRTIGDTYRSVQQWAEREGVSLRGASYERYIIDPWSTTRSDHYVTELIFPIGGNEHV